VIALRRTATKGTSSVSVRPELRSLPVSPDVVAADCQFRPEPNHSLAVVHSPVVSVLCRCVKQLKTIRLIGSAQREPLAYFRVADAWR
jgi:hypothetical protein